MFTYKPIGPNGPSYLRVTKAHAQISQSVRRSSLLMNTLNSHPESIMAKTNMAATFLAVSLGLNKDYICKQHKPIKYIAISLVALVVVSLVVVFTYCTSGVN